MRKMNIGTYYPANTIIHNIDARIKVLISLMNMVLIFQSYSLITLLFVFVMLATVIFIAKLPLKAFFALLTVSRFMLIIFAISLFLVEGDDVIFSIGPLIATMEGANAGFRLAVRILLILTSTTILTLTTKPLILTKAFELLLSPLMKIKIPIAEMSLMLNLAMRFVPTIMDEKDRIVNAQIARGLVIDEGHLIKRVKKMIPVFLPIILSALNRAEELAIAMDSRNFKIGKPRSDFHEFSLTFKDGILFLTYGGCFLLLFVIDRVISTNF